MKERNAEDQAQLVKDFNNREPSINASMIDIQDTAYELGLKRGIAEATPDPQAEEFKRANTSANFSRCIMLDEQLGWACARLDRHMSTPWNSNGKTPTSWREHFEQLSSKQADAPGDQP